MSGVRLGNMAVLHLLWLLPVLLALYVYAAYRRQQALRLFIDAGLLDRIPIFVSRVKRRGKEAVSLAESLLQKDEG